MREQILKLVVFDLILCPAQDQQTGSVAKWGGVLRDQFIGQLKIEGSGLHGRNISAL